MRNAGGIALAMLLSVPTLSTAQNDEDLRRQGYVFAAPGAFLYEGAATTHEVGGGMQWLVYGGLGLGFDASLMGFAECFSCRMALGSFAAPYHSVSRRHHVLALQLRHHHAAFDVEGGARIPGRFLQRFAQHTLALRLKYNAPQTTRRRQRTLGG